MLQLNLLVMQPVNYLRDLPPLIAVCTKVDPTDDAKLLANRSGRRVLSGF